MHSAHTPISPTFNAPSSSSLSPPAASASTASAASSAYSSSPSGMQASVLATLVDVSVLATGLPLSFILLGSKAVAVTSQSSLILALYFGLPSSQPLDEDMLILFRSFASTLANTLLSSFLSLFPTLETRGIVASRDFDAFGSRIPDALKTTAKQILNELALDPAIANCILVERDNVLHSTGSVEALAFVANLQVLNSTANDLCNTLSLFFFFFSFFLLLLVELTLRSKSTSEYGARFSAGCPPSWKEVSYLHVHCGLVPVDCPRQAGGSVPGR